MKAIDLHTHSSYSDGSLSPAKLIDRAVEQNLAALSITDHDTMAGTAEAIEYCRQQDIKYFPGVEISTHIRTLSLHLLGYCLDHTSSELLNFLDMIQQSRRDRNETIFLRLNRMGIKLSLADIAESQQHASQIGRPHIAQLLVQRKVVHTEQEAFSRFLRKNAAAYVQRKVLPTQQAISAIHAAGGIAVLAHPAGLGLSEKSLALLVAELKEAGLTGVEVYHPVHSDKNVAFLEKLCHKHTLTPTGGSDFHGRERDKTVLGEYGGNRPIPGLLINNFKSYSAVQ